MHKVVADCTAFGRTVTLATGALGPSLAKGGRKSVAKRLTKLAVTVLANATVTRVDKDRIILRDGTTIPSAITVWTAGFGVPTLAARTAACVPTGSVGYSPTTLSPASTIRRSSPPVMPHPPRGFRCE